MSFIGILTEHKNEIYLKKELEKRKWEDVYFLSENSIDNMRNITFETFVLGKEIEKNQEMVRSMAQKAKYFVLNSDIKENLPLLDNLDLTLITYGYNQKATITASSVEENKMMLCLQRSIKNVYNEEIEPQEIEIQMEQEASDDAVMELASLNLLYQKQK